MLCAGGMLAARSRAFGRTACPSSSAASPDSCAPCSPCSFMNVSGEAVGKLARFYRVSGSSRGMPGHLCMAPLLPSFMMWPHSL